MTVTTASRRVMGTSASVVVTDGEMSAEQVLDLLDDLERRWTRFNPDSELRRLNASAGGFTVVSDDTFELVRHLVGSMHLTGGRFDPTMGRRMRDLGYDRTYRDLDHAPPTTAVTTGEPTGRPPVRAGHLGNSIEIVVEAKAVLLPVGVELDPGGLGKGLAADLATHRAMTSGASGVLVEIGGDIVTRGTAAGGQPWRIRVPATDGHPERIVELTDGAVATSDTTVRTWCHGGVEHRHLLDPWTGQSVDGRIVATVVAGSGWWAEAVATAAIVSTARGDGWFSAFRPRHPEVTAFVSDGRSIDA